MHITMSLPTPALEMPESVAELEDALRRIRAGVPLATPHQMLYYCAYLAGAVDAQKGTVEQLSIDANGGPVQPSTYVEPSRDVRPSHGGAQPDTPFDWSTIHPRSWVSEIRAAFRMDPRTAKAAIALVGAAVLWYGWWLLVWLT
jgi:hypothetical protein